MKKPLLILQLICSMLSGNIAEQNLQFVKRDIKEPCKENLIVRYDPKGSLEGLGCYNKSSVDSSFTGLSSLNNLSSLTFHDPYTDQDLMDNGYCIKYCADYLFNYAAIGNGLECKCGNDTAFQVYKIVDETLSDQICNASCTFPVSINSNATYQCGGKNAYTVYEAKYDKKPSITVGKKLEIILNQSKDNRYIGCIPDSQYCGKRAMNDDDQVHTDEALTVDGCIDLCRERKFKYAGLEAGNQCFCSNSYNGLPTNSNQERCSTSCAGDSSQICGGSWALSIYKVSKKGLSDGQIAGIVVSSVVGASIIAGTSCYYWTPCRVLVRKFFHNILSRQNPSIDSINAIDPGGAPIELNNIGGSSTQVNNK